MSIDSIGGELGIYVGTFVVCFLAGLVPVINAELWLLAVTLMVASPAPLPAVVLLAAAGQMAGKVLLYFAALGALNMPTGRYKAKVDKARAKIQRWKGRPKWVLWASSVTGLPPFYVISLLAGALEIRLRTFCLIGMTGRTLRFGTLVALTYAGSTA